MRFNNEDFILTIESTRIEAKDYIAEGKGTCRKNTKLVEYIITESDKSAGKRISRKKYRSVSFLTFVLHGFK